MFFFFFYVSPHKAGATEAGSHGGQRNRPPWRIVLVPAYHYQATSRVARRGQDDTAAERQNRLLHEGIVRLVQMPSKFQVFLLSFHHINF